MHMSPVVTRCSDLTPYTSSIYSIHLGNFERDRRHVHTQTYYLLELV